MIMIIIMIILLLIMSMIMIITISTLSCRGLGTPTVGLCAFGLLCGAHPQTEHLDV